MTWTDAQRRYAHSAKGRESRKKYQMSDRGKVARSRYMEKRRQKLEEKAIELVDRIDGLDKQKELKQQPKPEVKKENVKKHI
jgi:hypothetical protein